MEGDELEMTGDELQMWIAKQIKDNNCVSQELLEKCRMLSTVLEKKAQEGTRILRLCESVAKYEAIVKKQYALLGWEYRDTDSEADEDITDNGVATESSCESRNESQSKTQTHYLKPVVVLMRLPEHKIRALIGLPIQHTYSDDEASSISCDSDVWEPEEHFSNDSDFSECSVPDDFFLRCSPSGSENGGKKRKKKNQLNGKGKKTKAGASPTTSRSSRSSSKSSTASAKPSTSRAKPSKSEAKPSTSEAQPSTSGVKSSTPSVSSSVTATKPSTPAAKSSTPAAKSSTPAAKSSTPAAKSSTPAAKSSTPATKSSTPAAKSSTPAAKSSTPAAKSSTPTSKPSTPAAKPSTPAAKPSTQAAKPSTQAAKPSTTAAKPSTTAAKPSTTAAKPSTTAAKPSTTAAKPSTPSTSSSVTATKSLTPSSNSSTTATKPSPLGTKSTEKTPPHDRPAKAPVVLPEITEGLTVLARKKAMRWYRGNVVEIVRKENGSVKYKVAFENDLGKVLVSGHHIAFDFMHKLDQLPELARVLVRNPNETWFCPGILVERPGRKNRMRFLVFLDDHTPIYVSLPLLRLVCKPLPNPWDDIPEGMHKNFVEQHTKWLPNPPLTQCMLGQTMKVKVKDELRKCSVVQVDFNLIEVLFEEDERKEWIYRGSPRLEHIINMTKYLLSSDTKTDDKK